ncbi:MULTISPECIES: response regulator transcription factor [Methylicorpusculum]|uniref:response regulator transcription factor n=3 Tax=Methylococcaceae TaxID=403 RepID=UPI00135B68F6|nr:MULTISPECIES: response regulator transcription factor [Methylicorpusculum]MCD2452720.1 response regulator transcription factor [Methylicorpusculum oleiharenae]MDO8846565.1 response regulator transcription factor [Methylicorpusculum sp.]MDP2178716.1 response regulator transcription factor [Methylicorpusculum sp.]MDP3531648.1 response regulator transcription factor [Methylicorpusculum sp.]
MMQTGRKKDVVLIVDDSPETLSMLNDTLDQAGLTVLVALEGAQALTIVDNITPDIILMDAIMPHMDGFEACKRLKANRSLAHIPVIFMTGLSDTESIVKGLQAGGVDYINKPVKGDELIARMQVHLANARLTLSAQTALDTAGQYLFAASSEGALLWTTPQANQLFNTAGVTIDWLEENLPNQLRQLLQPQFNKEKGLLIKVNEKPLEIRYIGQTGANEFLLRLIDLQRPSEIERLRSALPITEREAEVLLWIARGKTNREIGTILSMSPRTVNKHLEQVFRKLNVENRTTAAVFAMKYLNQES